MGRSKRKNLVRLSRLMRRLSLWDFLVAGRTSPACKLSVRPVSSHGTSRLPLGVPNRSAESMETQAFERLQAGAAEPAAKDLK
jgi:hypothetical protein